MLENLLQMVKDFGQQEVVENPAIPNEQNQAVMAEASHAVAGTLQQQVAMGNIGSVMYFFKNNDSNEIMNTPVAQKMQSGFLENITGKLGIDKNVAAGLAASFIPMIVNQLVRRTNSTAAGDSGFNLNSLVSQLGAGGNGHGFGDLINQFTGGNSTGGFNPGNTVSRITNQQVNNEQSGGLSSLINGFFGR